MHHAPKRSLKSTSGSFKVTPPSLRKRVHCNPMQHAAAFCNTLQQAATRFPYPGDAAVPAQAVQPRRDGRRRRRGEQQLAGSRIVHQAVL
jgi:hypothetical protein